MHNEKKLGEDPEKRGLIEYCRFSARDWAKVLSATLVVYLTIWAVLFFLTDSPVPHRDAFNTTLNIVGTWALGRKVIEVWGFWFVANVASVYLYIVRSATDPALYDSLSAHLPHWLAVTLSQDMLSTIFLYLFYTGASVYGFWKWKKYGVRIGFRM